MFENLEPVKEKFDEIEKSLCDPSVSSDIGRYTELLKERAKLEGIVGLYIKFRETEARLAEINELKNSSDKELRELAELEEDEAKSELEKLSEALKKELTPKDPNDEKSVIVEIRAGTGGEEAALFASELFRMYSMFAETKKYKIEVLNVNETGLGGFKEITFEVKGKGAYSTLKFESGVHRVQRVPETESQGRIQTSAATVAVLPEAEEVELELDPKDLQIDVFRSSGAGGQKVNKTSSAIRITYLPTGLVVECQDERSQFKNKDKAMRVLRSRLLKEKQENADRERSDRRKSLVGSGDRSERIRTYNFPQGRITDHRIGLTLYKIDSIMDGDLDELINALTLADEARKAAEVPNT